MVYCFGLVYVLIVLIVCCDLRCLVIVDYVGCFGFLSLGFELPACLVGCLVFVVRGLWFGLLVLLFCLGML